jgi:hypothetical protein
MVKTKQLPRKTYRPHYPEALILSRKNQSKIKKIRHFAPNGTALMPDLRALQMRRKWHPKIDPGSALKKGGKKACFRPQFKAAQREFGQWISGGL